MVLCQIPTISPSNPGVGEWGMPLIGALPRAHVQGVKQSLSVVVVVTKIARSRVLGICACCNYHESVDIVEKLVSVRFELLNMAH